MPASVLNLEDFKATTTSATQFRLGEVASIFDPTFGSMKAVWCKIQDAVTAALCHPVFEDIGAGYWNVDEDENEVGVVGQEFCVGAFLMKTKTTAACYGWVLVAGLNPLAMVTAGNVDAGDILIASTTDGTWNGIAPKTSVAATTGDSYHQLAIAPAVATSADTSNALAIGDAMFNSIWGGLPVSLT